jgi:hypothetical protein
MSDCCSHHRVRAAVHVTAVDYAAIDYTGDDGRQLPGGHRHHGLVQQPEALLDPPLIDQGAALVMYGEGEQVSIAEALADLGSFGCGGVRGLVVTGRRVLHHNRHQQVAPLDAVALLAFEQPLGTPEPSGSVSHLSLEGEMGAHPESAAHCAHHFSGVEVYVMGTFQAPEEVVDATDHEGRRCEQLEVLRSQRSRLIGA